MLRFVLIATLAVTACIAAPLETSKDGVGLSSVKSSDPKRDVPVSAPAGQKDKNIAIQPIKPIPGQPIVPSSAPAAIYVTPAAVQPTQGNVNKNIHKRDLPAPVAGTKPQTNDKSKDEKKPQVSAPSATLTKVEKQHDKRETPIQKEAPKIQNPSTQVQQSKVQTSNVASQQPKAPEKVHQKRESGHDHDHDHHHRDEHKSGQTHPDVHHPVPASNHDSHHDHHDDHHHKREAPASSAPARKPEQSTNNGERVDDSKSPSFVFPVPVDHIVKQPAIKPTNTDANQATTSKVAAPAAPVKDAQQDNKKVSPVAAHA